MQQFTVVYLHMRYIHYQRTYGLLTGFITGAGTKNVHENVYGFISSKSGCTVWLEQSCSFSSNKTTNCITRSLYTVPPTVD